MYAFADLCFCLLLQNLVSINFYPKENPTIDIKFIFFAWNFQTRNMSVAIIIFASNLTCFLFLVSFPKTLEVIHLYGYMTICGILCILGTIFIAIVLKETNGMCLDDVGSKKKRKRIHSVQEIENTRVWKYVVD